MKNSVIGIYGASGFGKEVYPLIRESFPTTPIFFIDDGSSLDSLNGTKVQKFDEFLKTKAKEHLAVIAIANSRIREQLTQKCRSNNISILDVKAENSIMMDEVNIQPGSIICPFVSLTSNIRIGEGFHANLYSYVAHDCLIGNYVTFAPGVKCNGNVHIGDHAYIGTGAIIHQGKPNRPLKIGKGAVIAAGAVVTKNIPDGVTVFGNPAIELTKENLKRRS